MEKKGKLIVLDGLDGCGKSTQFEAVQKSLAQQGKPVKAISFPMYEKPSAALVKMYLGGEFSDTPGGVNAYAASSFYAVDRYANYKLDWEQNYRRGEWILASRYTTSNAIHQMSKLPEEQWDSYLEWLADYEYDKLGLPGRIWCCFCRFRWSFLRSFSPGGMPETLPGKTFTRQTLPISGAVMRRRAMPGRSCTGGGFCARMLPACCR